MPSVKLTISLPQPIYDKLNADPNGLSVTARMRMLAIQYVEQLPAPKPVREPKPEPVRDPYGREAKAREELEERLDFYVNERGARIRDLLNRPENVRWHEYLLAIRGQGHASSANRIRDPLACEREVKAVIARRAALYAEHGIEPPGLPTCRHGVPMDETCEKCENSARLAEQAFRGMEQPVEQPTREKPGFGDNLDIKKWIAGEIKTPGT